MTQLYTVRTEEVLDLLPQLMERITWGMNSRDSPVKLLTQSPV